MSVRRMTVVGLARGADELSAEPVMLQSQLGCSVIHFDTYWFWIIGQWNVQHGSTALQSTVLHSSHRCMSPWRLLQPEPLPWMLARASAGQESHPQRA